MNWLFENWYILLGITAVLGAAIWAVYKFLGLPTKEQVTKIKEWLLLAVTEAETQLGGGTGQIKLRYVYDMFISKFPITAKLVSFELFSLWVDDALRQMKILLETNEAVMKLVKSE
ncbi:hypothetical protein KQI61_07995 [Anaerocolumna aminovalerica]|uniref:hypothetical protein n=1 Tax=Anaerocolumna aminovalerica TaxID=1527 RepID=UPI001C0EB699|nr:hypothetical protein [Anaerocolumna aminovalerica]MBU5332138.1 hypothetical protein [Anaerocolumna aminovalerica]